jgi:predicted tellurium resistance membrane protein TerC
MFNSSRVTLIRSKFIVGIEENVIILFLGTHYCVFNLVLIYDLISTLVECYLPVEKCMLKIMVTWSEVQI